MLRFAAGLSRANGHNFTNRVLALSAAVAAMLTGTAAVAESGASDSSGIEEIVVTANKLNSQKVLDIPLSIQAISGDTLQAGNVSGIMDVAGQIPGLSIQDLGPGDKKYVIRGINSTGDATTGVYYGEAVISGSNADDGGGFEPDIRLYDMDHIEVLRGPQGTLYGASSMSGTIRFIPKSPDLNNLGGYLTMEGSQTEHASGNYNFNGAVNLPDHRRRAGAAPGRLETLRQRLHQPDPRRRRRHRSRQRRERPPIRTINPLRFRGAWIRQGRQR